MQVRLTSLLQLLFPPSHDELLIDACTEEQFALKLHAHTVLPDISALSSFKDPQMRAALHLCKYHNHPQAAGLLAALLSAWLASQTDSLVIIPVPLSRARLRQRGHNQVETVARQALRGEARHTVYTDVLYRTRNTSPQTTLRKEQRMQNLAGAFEVRPEKLIFLQEKHVILLDDVVTTGATLHSAYTALQSSRASSVQCVALAH